MHRTFVTHVEKEERILISFGLKNEKSSLRKYVISDYVICEQNDGESSSVKVYVCVRVCSDCATIPAPVFRTHFSEQ